MSIIINKNKLKVIDVNNESFTQSWKSFQSEYPMYSNRYQLPIFEYYEMMSNKPISQSFIIKNEATDTSLAICPLTIEEVEGRLQASFHKGMLLPVPLFHPKLTIKQTRALEKLVFDEIKSRLADNNVGLLFTEADMMTVGLDRLEDQMPAVYGALDISNQHHVMDLNLNDEKLWQQIRHSSKSIINRGLKTYEFRVYDQSNYSSNVGERHALLHHKTSGRMTRPQATFDKMNSWIPAGCGLMFEQLFKNQVVQMIIVGLGKCVAVGASAADDPDFDPPVPLTHSMNYFIYKETQKRGIKYFDVGKTAFRSTPYRIFTPKEMTIHYFKRGFGSRSFPLKRWVYFTSPEEEIKYLEKKLRKYKKFIMNDSRNFEGD